MSKTFEQYMTRPVYVARCKTWKKADEFGLCVAGIRRLPAYRTEEHRIIRKIIAVAMRMQRAEERHIA